MAIHGYGVVVGVILFGAVASAQTTVIPPSNTSAWQLPYIPLPPERTYQYGPAAAPAAYQSPYASLPAYSNPGPPAVQQAPNAPSAVYPYRSNPTADTAVYETPTVPAAPQPYPYAPAVDSPIYQPPYVPPSGYPYYPAPAVDRAAYPSPGIPLANGSPAYGPPVAVGSAPPQTYPYNHAIAPGFAVNSQIPSRPASGEVAPSCNEDSPEPSDAFSHTNFGVRVGTFTLRNWVGSEVYGALPSLGIELKRHFGSSPFAISTSMDFAGGQGDPIAYGGTGESELNSFAWRFTALLEPKPGAWGTEDGKFYVNPYFGLGLGYHRIQEELSMTSSWGDTYGAGEDLDAFGSHAVLGVDLVLRRKFSLGCSLVSSVANADGGWQGDTEIGGDTLFLNLDGRF